jgi:pyochelin biosynthetic protein PchC
MTLTQQPRTAGAVAPSLIRLTDPSFAEVDLVCFAAAGEPAARFHGWAEHVPESVALFAAERPSRGRRSSEPVEARLTNLVEEASRDIGQCCSRPVILVGHSVGSLVAHAVAHELETRGISVRAVVSCHGRSPSDGRPIPWVTMSDQALIDEIIAARPGSAGIFDRPDFVEVILPALRADLALYENRDRPAPTVNAPVIAFAGVSDPLVKPADIWRWREVTSGAFLGHTVQGGHFQPTDDPGQFVHVVTSSIRAIVQEPT